jgi:hypothetical protein
MMERIKNCLEPGLPFICLGLTTIGSKRHQVIDYESAGSLYISATMIITELSNSIIRYCRGPDVPRDEL